MTEAKTKIGNAELTATQLPLIEAMPEPLPPLLPPSSADIWLVACWWVQGRSWSIKRDNWLSRETAEQEGRDLVRRGWQHVRIIHVHLGEEDGTKTGSNADGSAIHDR